MQKILLFIVFLFFTTVSDLNAQTTLKILKGLDVQLEYKQGHLITLQTKDGIITKGIIYLVETDSIYLDNYTKNVALKDIVAILPIFNPNFETHKPSGFTEWFIGIYMSVMALISFDYGSLRQMWLPNTYDHANLTNKQKRMRKKTFTIGGKYKLVASN